MEFSEYRLFTFTFVFRYVAVFPPLVDLLPCTEHINKFFTDILFVNPTASL